MSSHADIALLRMCRLLIGKSPWLWLASLYSVVQKLAFSTKAPYVTEVTNMEVPLPAQKKPVGIDIVVCIGCL
jgi:hypothetical protein